MNDSTPLISTSALAERLEDPRIAVVDGSWYLPSTERDAHAEYRKAHIPGSVFVDLDRLSDSASPLPHMLPSADQFAREVGARGIGDASQVVVYDHSGTNLSAARIWWMFRAFGHQQVAVLDGGLGKWIGEKRPVENGEVVPGPAVFTARFQSDLVRDLLAMQANLASAREQVVDARPAGRYAGTEPAPRPGLRGGHLPGSHCLPFNRLVEPDGTLLPARELRERFTEAGVDLTRPIIATCGSGTSACALLLALHIVGIRSYSLYDGSWTEWGGRRDLPIEIGPG
jgi:thiosulfate/3-mercaptopyruvate sulfurtransferase